MLHFMQSGTSYNRYYVNFFLENILRKALNDSLIILLSNVLFLMITLYLMDSLLMSYLFTLTLLDLLSYACSDLNIIKTLVLFPSVLVCNKLNTIISRNKSQFITISFWYIVHYLIDHRFILLNESCRVIIHIWILYPVDNQFEIIS